MTRIQAKIKEAVHRADKTAKAQNYYKPCYQQDGKPSIRKLQLQLGEFLLLLNSPLGQNQQSGLLQTFEKMLNEYIDLKYAGVQL